MASMSASRSATLLSKKLLRFTVAVPSASLSSADAVAAAAAVVVRDLESSTATEWGAWPKPCPRQTALDALACIDWLEK